VTILDRLLADPEQTAFALARKHNLVCVDGTVVCWECRRHEALIPSLHCAVCLQAVWQRCNINNPCCEQREQTEEDKRRMAPNQET
jgi:hypothetical protein